MSNGKAQPATNTHSKWRDAILWAILSALVSQLGENYVLERAVGHQLDKAETDLRQIENELIPCPGAR